MKHNLGFIRFPIIVLFYAAVVVVVVVFAHEFKSNSGESGKHQEQKIYAKQNYASNNANNQNCCFPSQGNLLIGRKHQLYASSTCGLERPERFCVLDASTRPKSKTVYRAPVSNKEHFILIVNNIIKSPTCEICDSRHSFERNVHSHRIENVVKYDRLGGGRLAHAQQQKWWQSENNKENVSIRFDLEAEFVLTRLLIKFKYFPPQAMSLEKSADFGKTWHTLAYYASDCAAFFANVSATSKILLDHAAACTNRYSNVDARELIYRPLINEKQEPYLLAVNSKFTNLRINFKKLFKLDHNRWPIQIRNDSSLTWKYYYAISELEVMGFCSCNGHAKKCVRLNSDTTRLFDSDSVSVHNNDEMTHASCECLHNTAGLNCEKCLPMYNDLEWRPGGSRAAYECKKCECNGHAHSCHFDFGVFLRKQAKSGGVCDNCMHNTAGVNCERCKKNFYHDKSLPFTHPQACKPCDCNPMGTRSRMCTNDDDKKCECKMNVMGEKCDKCKNGYWNLSKQNRNGCQKCECNLAGTLHNLGCDKTTGACLACKPNVIGRRCDACMHEFYGNLSDVLASGCRACACTAGLTYAHDCDRVTGMCDCIAHAHGRRCDHIRRGYFCASIDHILYEAEYDAVKVGAAHNTSLQAVDAKLVHSVAHANKRSKSVKSWTGLGYLKVYSGEVIKFRVKHAEKTGLFDIVLRYDVRNEFLYTDDRWEASLKIVRLSSFHESSSRKSCSNFHSNHQNSQRFRVQLENHRTSRILLSKYCLDEASHYEIYLSLKMCAQSRKIRSTYYSASQIPTIYVDSLLFIPSYDHLLQTNEERSRFQYKKLLECRDVYINLPRKETRLCNKLICQASAKMFGLLPCQCDAQGSFNNTCNPIGGQCACKANIINRRCDKCKPNTWDFSSYGCKSCNCNAYGSKTNRCDPLTGQCACFDSVGGEHCDTCLRGHFQHPKCFKCECNGHSETCDSYTGFCLQCAHNTEGNYCEKCTHGYYGAPKLGVPCKPCTCPGLHAANNFSNGCVYDAKSDKQMCLCRPGYRGERCDECEHMHYGDPLKNVACSKCQCNNNVDTNDASSCDKRTGACNNCLFNTEGANCEKCRPGFYGNATLHKCEPCKCSTHGTIGNSEHNCDALTGQCKCLPNVVGQKCDRCKSEHWNLHSSRGCSSCECDPSLTLNNSTDCDQFSGQCDCASNRGGRLCNECPFSHWGKPDNSCQKCDCMLAGSQTAQCNKATGECLCNEGVTGFRCDRCDRGTTGAAPYCKKCGECFDTWDKSVDFLNEFLKSLEQKAEDTYSFLSIKNSTVLISFNTQYSEINSKYSDILLALNLNKSGVAEAAKSNETLLKIKKFALKLGEIFTKKIDSLKNFSSAKLVLDDQRKSFDSIRNDARLLFEMALRVKESNFNGAKESMEKSLALSQRASHSLNESMLNFGQEFGATLMELKTELDHLNSSLLEENYFHLIRNRHRTANRAVLVETNQLMDRLNEYACVGGEQKLESSRNCSNGFSLAYAKLANATEKLANTLREDEKLFKIYLMKKNEHKFAFKNSYDTILSLDKTASSHFSKHNNQVKTMSYLIGQVETQASVELNKRAEIQRTCEAVNAHATKNLDAEFDEQIEKIKTKFEYNDNQHAISGLDLEYVAFSRQALNHLNLFENESRLLHDELQQADKLANLNKDSIAKLDEYQATFALENAALESAQFSIGLLLGTIDQNLTKIEQSAIMRNEVLIENSVLGQKEFNKLDNNDSIRNKLTAASQKLSLLGQSLDVLFEDFDLNNKENDEHSMSLLLQLNEKIIEKKSELNAHVEQIQLFEQQMLSVEQQVDFLRTEVNYLSMNARHVKSKTQENFIFAKNCN